MRQPCLPLPTRYSGCALRRILKGLHPKNGMQWPKSEGYTAADQFVPLRRITGKSAPDVTLNWAGPEGMYPHVSDQDCFADPFDEDPFERDCAGLDDE